MSLAIAGANVGFDTFLGVSARDINHATKSYPVLHPRQRQNGTTTVPSGDIVNMFIDSQDEDWGYAASVVEACGGQTVIALQCTSGAFVGSQTCGPNAGKIILTVNPTTYHYSTAVTTSTRGSQVSATAIEACSLQGTTAATCSVTIGGTVDGKKTSTVVPTTIASPTYWRYDVAITGGAEKTANVAAACTGASGPSASGTKDSAAVVNTKSMMLWALAGVATGILTLL